MRVSTTKTMLEPIIRRRFNPIGSMYGIFTYIYHKNQPNVGKYTIPMDPMGIVKCTIPNIPDIPKRVDEATKMGGL